MKTINKMTFYSILAAGANEKKTAIGKNVSTVVLMVNGIATAMRIKTQSTVTYLGV